MMLSPKIVSKYQVQSLANLREAATLTLTMLQQFHDLSLRAIQAGTGVPLRRAPVPGARVPAGNEAGGVGELCHESLHLTSAWLIDLVKVAESQWALSHRCAHAALQDFHQWTPREMETSVEALDLVLDAAEFATENLADAGVLVVKRLEDGGALLYTTRKGVSALVDTH